MAVNMFQLPPDRPRSLVRSLLDTVQREGEKRFGKEFKCLASQPRASDPLTQDIDIAVKVPRGTQLFGVVHRVYDGRPGRDFIRKLLDDLASKLPAPALSAHDADMAGRLELSLA